MLKKTHYLFDNAKFRNHLIDKILDGTIQIDQNICDCIYKVEKKKGVLVLSTTRVNGDGTQKCNYQQTLNNMGHSMEFLGQGSYGLASKICLDPLCNLSYAIKVIMYNNNQLFGQLDNPIRPENIELTVFQKLNKEILLTKVSPHIILYIQHFRCDGVPALWSSGTQIEFDEYSSQLLENFYHTDHALILVSELAQYGSLNSYLKNQSITFDEHILSILFFQFIYTFAQIQKTFPGFRHNDSHGGNILVQKDENYEPTKQKYYIYHYNNTFYKIPVIDPQIKIWDFDFSNIIGHTENQDGQGNLKAKIFNPNEFGYRHTKNHYYDLHIFVNDLLMKIYGAYQGYDSMLAIPKMSPLIQLFHEIIPFEYAGINTQNTGFGRLKHDIEITTPERVLFGPYIKNKFSVLIDSIDLNEVVDVYGIDLMELKNLLQSSKSSIIPKIQLKKKQHIDQNSSICQIPKIKKVYPTGYCLQQKHHPCPQKSRWCSYCFQNIEQCNNQKFPRIKGNYSFKRPK